VSRTHVLERQSNGICFTVWADTRLKRFVRETARIYRAQPVGELINNSFERAIHSAKRTKNLL